MDVATPTGARIAHRRPRYVLVWTRSEECTTRRRSRPKRERGPRFLSAKSSRRQRSSSGRYFLGTRFCRSSLAPGLGICGAELFTDAKRFMVFPLSVARVQEACVWIRGTARRELTSGGGKKVAMGGPERKEWGEDLWREGTYQRARAGFSGSRRQPCRHVTAWLKEPLWQGSEYRSGTRNLTPETTPDTCTVVSCRIGS